MEDKNLVNEENLNVENIEEVTVDENKEVTEEKFEEVEVNNEEKIEKSNNKRKRHGVLRFILNTLSFLVLIAVIVLTYLGFTGFNAVKSDKEPEYYFDKREYTSSDGKTVTSYDFLLYRAEKIEDSKKYSYRLVPFFIK